MGEYRVQRMKETSIGLIPEDWEAKSLSQIGIFSKGKGVSRANAQSGDIPCVRYGEIYTSHNDFIREFYSHISPEIAATATKLKKGDVLFAGSGETKEEIGKAVAYLGDEEAYAGGDIIILSPNDGASSKFLGYVLNGAIAVNQNASMGQGDAVVHIHAKELADVVIPFPPYDEQKKIADVLSAVDELIDALDEAIAKKRQIKEGLMQQLLTGKTRLPGFSGEWKEWILGEVATVRSGFPFKSETYTYSGNYTVITIANVQNGYLNLDECNKINDYPKGLQEFQKLKNNDILISMTGNVGRVCRVSKQNCLLNQRVGLIDPKGIISNKFLYTILNSLYFEKAMVDKGQGAAQANLSNKDIEAYTFIAPTTIEEQEAIASSLQSVTDVINSLKSNSNKYRLIKQGMMQELLTGKTRLI